MAFDYDLFVIGGGSGGVRAARIASAEGGARVALNDLSFNVDLPDAPQAHSSVPLKMGRDRVVGTLATGLSAMIGQKLEISGRYEAILGKETRGRTATLKAAYKF